MLKFPLHYPGGKSRTVETIAKLIPDFSDFVLKGHILVTAGERSVTCGSKDGQSTTLACGNKEGSTTTLACGSKEDRGLVLRTKPSNATLACGYENQALRAKQRTNRIAALPVDAKKR